MNEQTVAVVVVGIIGSILVMARRWKNKDDEAGYGIAGWTIFIIFILLCGKACGFTQ